MLPQLVVLTLSVWSVGGMFIAVTAPAIASVTEPVPNLAALAALRARQDDPSAIIREHVAWALRRHAAGS